MNYCDIVDRLKKQHVLTFPHVHRRVLRRALKCYSDSLLDFNDEMSQWQVEEIQECGSLYTSFWKGAGAYNLNGGDLNLMVIALNYYAEQLASESLDCEHTLDVLDFIESL